MRPRRNKDISQKSAILFGAILDADSADDTGPDSAPQSPTDEARKHDSDTSLQEHNTTGTNPIILGPSLNTTTWTRAEKQRLGFSKTHSGEVSKVLVTWPCSLSESHWIGYPKISRTGFLGGALHLLICNGNQASSFRSMFRKDTTQACFRLHFANVELREGEELNWEFEKRLDFFVQEVLRVRLDQPCEMFVVVTDGERDGGGFEGGVTLGWAKGEEAEGPGKKIMENKGIAVFVGTTEAAFLKKEPGRER